jgi:hypothetical protein
MATEPYNEASLPVSLNSSNLYNAMIYPFTRIVIYGVIWYQGKQQKFDVSPRYSLTLFM